MEQERRAVETRDQAVHRLAALAEERGIGIHWHDRGAIREYFATSAAIAKGSSGINGAATSPGSSPSWTSCPRCPSRRRRSR